MSLVGALQQRLPPLQQQRQLLVELGSTHRWKLGQRAWYRQKMRTSSRFSRLKTRVAQALHRRRLPALHLRLTTLVVEQRMAGTAGGCDTVSCQKAGLFSNAREMELEARNGDGASLHKYRPQSFPIQYCINTTVRYGRTSCSSAYFCEIGYLYGSFLIVHIRNTPSIRLFVNSPC